MMSAWVSGAIVVKHLQNGANLYTSELHASLAFGTSALVFLVWKAVTPQAAPVGKGKGTTSTFALTAVAAVLIAIIAAMSGSSMLKATMGQALLAVGHICMFHCLMVLLPRTFTVGEALLFTKVGKTLFGHLSSCFGSFPGYKNFFFAFLKCRLLRSLRCQWSMQSGPLHFLHEKLLAIYRHTG